MKWKAHHLKWSLIGMLILLLVVYENDSYEIRTREVTAKAYNSLASQTDNEGPNIAAWGDRLEPGMKCIAVSRDLIPLGLDHKTAVTIEGLPGVYIVLDKMNKRHKNTIDIYMGIDKKAATLWGKKRVNISWKVPKH